MTENENYKVDVPEGTSGDWTRFDIWDGLCTDNLVEMATLHRRFARRVGWYGSWGHGLLLARRDRERQQDRWYC